MNYLDLQEIIKHLKRVIACNTCKKRFGNENFFVVSCFQNEAILYADCYNCQSRLLIHVAIVNQKQERGTLNIQTHHQGRISQNEVLDMHNFLNQFNGDFKDLFTRAE